MNWPDILICRLASSLTLKVVSESHGNRIQIPFSTLKAKKLSFLFAWNKICWNETGYFHRNSYLKLFFCLLKQGYDENIDYHNYFIKSPLTEFWRFIYCIGMLIQYMNRSLKASCISAILKEKKIWTLKSNKKVL